MGGSAIAEGWPVVPFVFGDTAWKGNSPGSFGDRGEPVGADRIILGPGSDEEGICISSISFALSPARNGEETRGGSCLPSTAIGAMSLGGRLAGGAAVSGLSAMMGVKVDEWRRRFPGLVKEA
jgi:hypothetical protein